MTAWFDGPCPRSSARAAESLPPPATASHVPPGALPCPYTNGIRESSGGSRFAPLRTASVARAATRREHALFAAAYSSSVSSPRACRSASCAACGRRRRAAARAVASAGPQPLGESRPRVAQDRRRRSRPGTRAASARRIHSIQTATSADDDELARRRAKSSTGPVRSRRARRRASAPYGVARGARSAGRERSRRTPTARGPGPASQAASRKSRPTTIWRRNEPRRSSVRMSHALLAGRAGSRCRSASSPTRYLPTRFTASEPEHARDGDRDADRAHRQPAPVAGEPERQPEERRA